MGEVLRFSHISFEKNERLYNGKIKFLSGNKKEILLNDIKIQAEIQLRTVAMDSWASLEHQLRYKKDFEFTEHMANELQICAHLSAELDARMDALRDLVQTGNNV